jgi:peroxiredoxin
MFSIAYRWSEYGACDLQLKIKIGDKTYSPTNNNFLIEDLTAGVYDYQILGSTECASLGACELKHLPGFAQQAAAIKAKGVQTVACMSVNDVFVMAAWGKSLVPDGSVLMLADGNGEYTRALGLELDATGFGMGLRAKRFSMIIDNGKLKQLNIEPPGQFGLSSADTILEQLG